MLHLRQSDDTDAAKNSAADKVGRRCEAHVLPSLLLLEVFHQ